MPQVRISDSIASPEFKSLKGFNWDEPDHDYGAFYWAKPESNERFRPDLLLVFVHGILGNCKGTWDTLPTAIINALGVDCDVFSFDYPAGLFEQANISDAAKDLEIALRPRLQGYRHLVFITHSTGGLVLKTLLCADIEKTLEELNEINIAVQDVNAICLKTRRVINITVPHIGGKRWLTLFARAAYETVYAIARPLLFIGQIFSRSKYQLGHNDIIEELRWGNSALLDLEKRYLANMTTLGEACLPRPISIELLATADAAIAD